MIDLSFLTEAEQEAILKVLHRDAELKKAEDERIRQLHDVVEDEDELKYKSGQWFYEAKSKRHRDKIHGADLVRASIRKRKKPATIAELSENNMDKLKKSWVNNVNKDIFIPPELYGVMEELEEEQDHLKPVTVETNQSAKKVSFLSTGNDEGSLKATASPAKQRRNPFDTGDLVEADTDFREVKKQKPEHDNGSGKERPSNDILPSHILFGVKLPYPESKDVIQISPKAAGSSQKHVGTPPIPKPRTVNLKTKDQPSDGSSSPLKREDSVNGTGRRRGILKRRSSSSSTDSESIRITQNVDFVPPVSPILEVGTKSLPTEQVNESSPNSLEILKQVRFSANVTQNPPSPSPESFSGREIGEFKILEPNFSLNEWDKSAVNDNVSSDDSMPIRYPSSALDSDTWANVSQSVTSQSSLPVVSDSVADKMLLNKNNVESLFEEPEPALSLESQINAYTDPEPVYAVVKKVPKATSPDLQQEFDMEDDHMEPKYLGQRGKNQNVVHGGSPLQFGNSYGGGGKISSETNYRIGKPKEKNIFSNEESTDPEFNKRDQVIKDKLMPETKHGRNYVESADSVLNNQASKQPDANVTWRRPKILEQNESRRPVSTEGIEEPKIDARSPQDVYRGVSDSKEHTPVKEDLFQGKSKNFPEEPREKSTYKPVTFTDVHGVEKDKPVTHLYSPATQNVTSPNISVNSSSLDHVTYSSEEKGRPYPSPQSANFKIMAFKDRMNESPKDQISNPSQFQSLKSFWNVEDKSKPKPATDVLLSSKNLKDVLSRSRPINDDIQHRNSKEITTDFTILPNSLSEEEQTSQKVASWLAQSPSVYSGEKMYLSEEVVENIPKSVATRKANVDEFSSALKNLRGESSPAPHFTKVEAVETTDDIKTLPKEESDMPDIKGIKLKTTETISPAALNNVENEFSANEVKLDDKRFFEPVAQNTPNSSVNQTTKAFTPLEEQQSVGKTIEMSKDSLNNDSLGWEQQVKEAAKDTLPLRYKAHSKNETQRKANSKLESSSEYSQEEEIVQKTLAPSKTAHDEFKIGFERLLEEYESLPVEDIKIHPNVTDHTQEYQRPELNASKNDPDERNLNKSEEIIEKTTLPPPKDLHDFFDALSKLQIEASEPLSSIPESTSSTEQHVLYEKPRKEVTSLTDSPVIEVIDGTVDGHRNVSNKDQVDLNGISFNKASSTLKRDTQTPAEDVSMTFNILVEQIKFPVEREAIGSVDEAAERVEKSVVEAREHDDEFHNGLIRLQEEASSPFEGLLEPNISSEHVKQSNSEPEAPVEGSLEHPQEEEMIEKTLAPSKTANEAFKLGFEKLMEENNFPSENVKPSNSELEELEDQPKDNYVTFSRVPHVERFISKKVRTNIEPKESFNDERHGAEDEKESEQVLSDEVSSQRDLSSEPKDLAYPKGRSPHDVYLASHCESLAKNAGPDQSGSYAGNRENVLYKQPEIESPELSKPIFVDSKQGKPGLVDNQSQNTSSTSDKYTIEVMKATDESISKVLDWFNRSSETGDDKSLDLLESGSVEKTDQSFNSGAAKEEAAAKVEHSVDETLISENMTSISDHGQHKADKQSESRAKLSLGDRTNDGDESRNILHVESPININLEEVPEVTKNGDLNPQDSNLVQNGESLVFGKSKGGVGKMHHPFGMVKEPTANKGINEQLPIDLETKRLDYSEKNIEDSKGNYELVHLSVEKPALLVGVGTTELKGEVPVFLSQGSKQKEVGVTWSRPQINERSESLHQPIRQAPEKHKIEKKRLSDIKLFWEGDKDAHSLIQKPIFKEGTRPVGQTEIHVEESNPVIPRQNSFEYSPLDNNSNTRLVTFRKIILDDQPSTISHLKSFWEMGRNQTEMEKDKSRTNVPGREGGPSAIKHAYSAPSLQSEDLDVGKMCNTEPINKNKKRHALLSFFENDQTADTEPKKEFRSASLSEGTEEGVNELFKPLEFQSLRSFWSVGSNLQDNKDLTKQVGKSPETSNKTTFKFDIVKSQNPVETKVGKSQSLDENRAKNIQTTSQQRATDFPIDSKDKGNIPNELDTLEENNMDALNASECVSETICKTIASSKAELIDLSARLQKLKDEVPKQSTHTVDSKLEPISPVAFTPQNISFLNLIPHSYYDFPENAKQEKKLSTHERETAEELVAPQNSGTEKFKIGLPKLIKESEVSTLLPPKVICGENIQDNAPSVKDQNILTHRGEENENIIENPVLIRTPQSRSFSAGLQKLYNEYSDTLPISDEHSNTNEMLHHSVIEHQVQSGNEPDMHFNPYEAIMAGALPPSNREDRSSTSPFQPMEIQVSAKETPLNESRTDQNQDTLVQKIPETSDSFRKVVSGNVPPQSRSFENMVRHQHSGFQEKPNENKLEENLPENVPSPDKSYVYQPGGEIEDDIEKRIILPRTHFNTFSAGLQKLYNESLDMKPVLGEIGDQNEHLEENEPELELKNENVQDFPSGRTISTIQNISLSPNQLNESTSYQPIQISVSTKKMIPVVDESVSFGSPQQKVPKVSDSVVERSSTEIYKTVSPSKADIIEFNTRSRKQQNESSLGNTSFLLTALEATSPGIFPQQQQSGCFEKVEKNSKENLQTEIGETVEKTVFSQKPNYKFSIVLANLAREAEVSKESCDENTQGKGALPENQSETEVMEKMEKPVILPRTRFINFNAGLQKLYKESLNRKPTLCETTDLNEVSQENNPEQEVQHVNKEIYPSSTDPKSTIIPIKDAEATIISYQTRAVIASAREREVDESVYSGSKHQDAVKQEAEDAIEKTVAPTRATFVKSLEKLQQEAMEDEEGKSIGSMSSNQTASSPLQPQLNQTFIVDHASVSEMPLAEVDAWSIETPLAQQSNIFASGLTSKLVSRNEKKQSAESDDNLGRTPDVESVRQSTPVEDGNRSLRKSALELYLETPYRREMSKSIDFEHSGNITSEDDQQRRAEDIQPVYDALKRSAIKTVPSKNLEEVPHADPNRGKTGNSKEDLVRSNEHIYDDVPTENALMESQFSNPEKLKRLSQSVPAFLQDETDGRETDSASESSFHIGRHKKSPSSLTNLSGSSGMASMSSVSGSVMSMYSMDFGNVDIKGNIQFSIDYVEQLREFHVFVAQCKDLAVGDVKKQRSDPYVKSYLLPDKAKMGKRKTAVRKKTLNPSYNEILRYKIDRASLLNQKLNLAVWHNDPLGRNSFLGEVYLDLATWDWNNKQMNWYPLQPRTPAAGIGLENRGETKLALKYVPEAFTGLKSPGTGEVHIWIKECSSLPMLRGNKINSFIKCTILPDTSRKSRQKTRTVDKTPNPVFNHTMVYDGFKTEDLREACAELTVWDHNRLTNHFLGGLRIGLGSGKSYGTAVDWMDSSTDEVAMWEGMMSTPNTWIEAMLPLRMLKMAKLAK